MNPATIKKTILIDASVDKVWHVFTDPAVTRSMGGEYASDWKIGGPFGWKGLDGKQYTTGTILELDPERILKHNLSDLNDRNKLLSVITYEFYEQNNQTTIAATEEIKYEVSEEQLKDIEEGWNYALQAVKSTAEKI